ncbi:MAG: ribonuclease P protein component [Candidatus Nomurabacteria bacterium]|nr:ribonuclease P protein component [Candidatus Nomurabacteria bacterium]
MLPKKKRITKDIFQTILKKGNIVSGSFFLFRYIKESNPRYVFVVSKKIAKTATQRNSLRRRGYNILRQFKLKNCAGIFFYKKEALHVSIGELKKDIDFILEKIKLI